MQIIEVKQNWPNNYFRIDLSVGNICNFKCWYCPPGLNEGTYKWPDYDIFVRNVSHLFDYYAEHLGKNKFIINLVGGEPTHWKQFIKFVKHFKEHYDCTFTMHTNASKKLDWWAEAAPYLDSVSISHHEKFADRVHNRDVADLLYEYKVLPNIQVMMDPTDWDNCMASIEYFKGSRHRWTIRPGEVRHQNVLYTAEQNELLMQARVRSTNPIFFFMNNKSLVSKTQVVDTTGKSHTVDAHRIVLDRINKFNGWECNLGIDWLDARPDGSLGGSCQNNLFNQSTRYNILDSNFPEKFQPELIPTICHTNDCWCAFDAAMPKKNATN